MEILRHIEERDLSIPNPVLTMGNFDGIHLGHQALLQRVVEDARKRRGCSVVLTFEPHPLKILAPARAPRLLLSHKDKVQLLQSFGIDVVIIQNFDAKFAALEAEEFIQNYLIERIKVVRVWVGKDLRFGKGRKGRVQDLVRWGREGGFEVGVVEPILVGGVRISSSRIREMIEEGLVHEARSFLGRYPFISGRVVPGHQRGRDLGFPTANMAPRTEVIPLNGIYATLLEVDDKTWPSVTNVGVNPTFGSGPRTVESYIFDFQGDLYGKPLRLFFVERIREEIKFSKPDLLIAQMKADVARAQEILSGISWNEQVDITR